jgi:hypothetical protein
VPDARGGNGPVPYILNIVRMRWPIFSSQQQRQHVDFRDELYFH